MSKQDYCIHWVNLSHLTAEERRKAAVWACEQFGADSVDVMRLKEKIGRYGIESIPGFWFAREKDAVFFTLRWSR
jgi:hypothetical protein